MSVLADIKMGMAQAIWDIATAGTHRRASTHMLEKGAPAKAARDLADLYEDINDEGLETMFGNQKKRTADAEAFGFELARGAIEQTSMKRSLEGVGIVVPTFTVSYDKSENELTWEGSAPDIPVFDVEGFPRTGHRLVKPNSVEEDIGIENPAGQLTDKGERMYEHIKDSHGGDPRAAEIAMRTVYARAADGVPGLIKRHGKPPGVPNHGRKPVSREDLELLGAVSGYEEDGERVTHEWAEVDGERKLVTVRRKLHPPGVPNGARWDEVRKRPYVKKAGKVYAPWGEIRVGDVVEMPADREHGVPGGRATVVALHPGKNWNVTVESRGEEYDMNAMRLVRFISK